VRVTVQEVVPKEITEDGEQVTPLKEAAAAGETETVVVLVTPLQVAETVAEVTLVTVAAVAVKLAEDDPAGIVTEAGTGNAVPEVRATVVATAAAPVRVTVQLVFPLEVMVDGEQLTSFSPRLGETETLVVFVTPLKEAETITEESVGTDAAVAVKFAEVVP
jgi:hypothetical protein